MLYPNGFPFCNRNRNDFQLIEILSKIAVRLKSLVIVHAARRCEYCGLSQDGQEATFHIDHIYPFAAGDETTESNLALACVSCSLHKSARLTGTDIETGNMEPLYHPRNDSWHEHFRWNNEELIGNTPTGRATIEALKMNRQLILSIRIEEIFRGRHPQFPPNESA